VKNRENKKKIIIEYLAQGYPACKIHSFKSVSCTKGYISQVAKWAVRQGFLVEIKEKNNRGQHRSKYPKIYTYGHKKFSNANRRKFSNSPSGISLQAFEQPRLNMVSLQYVVIKKPSVELIGNVFWMGKTKVVDVRRSTAVGSVLFRFISDKKLVVMMPSFFGECDDFRSIKQRLFSYSQEVVNDLCKELDFRVGLPELYEPEEYGFNESDPYLELLCKKYGMLKVVDQDNNVLFWWDQSPKKKGICGRSDVEMETKEERLAEIKAFMPMIVDNLQDRVFQIGQDVAAQGMLLESFEYKLKDIQSSVEELLKLIKNNSKPDEFKEVA